MSYHSGSAGRQMQDGSSCRENRLHQVVGTCVYLAGRGHDHLLRRRQTHRIRSATGAPNRYALPILHKTNTHVVMPKPEFPRLGLGHFKPMSCAEYLLVTGDQTVRLCEHICTDKISASQMLTSIFPPASFIVHEGSGWKSWCGRYSFLPTTHHRPCWMEGQKNFESKELIIVRAVSKQGSARTLDSKHTAWAEFDIFPVPKPQTSWQGKGSNDEAKILTFVNTFAGERNW